VAVRITITPALWLALALTASAAHAAEAVAFRDTVFHLPEILVEAERISDLEDLRDRPAFVAIVPTDDVGRRVSSAAEYLAQAVGFHVRTTGSYGAYSTASIRGSSSKQVRVFLDGVPLNQSESGTIDLADLPLASISRIEVYRGFGPFDLSGSAIGGVVNLVTTGADRHGSGQVSVSYGSLSTQRYMASYSLSRSGWTLLALGTALASKGDFEFLDDNGTPYNLKDDSITRRLNNDVREFDALAKIAGPAGGGEIVATNQFYRRDQGLPGYSTLQSETERLAKIYDLFHVSWSKRPWGHVPLNLVLGLHYLHQTDRFEDRRPKTTGVKPDEKNRTVSWGATLRWKLALPAYLQHIHGMVALNREGFRPEETFVEKVVGERETRNTLSLTVEDEISLVGGRVRIVPSARYENYTDHTTPFSRVRSDLAAYYRGLVDARKVHILKAGSLSGIVTAGLGVRLKANYGRSYRVPSLMETFGYRGVVLPNPRLQSESGLNRDVGLQWDHHWDGGRFMSLELVHFRSDVSNLIMFTQVPWARSAHLNAIDTGPVAYTHGKHLPNRPGVEAFAKLTWCRKPVSAFYEFDYVSGNYWNAYNGVAPNNKGPLFPVRRLHCVGLTLPAGLHGTDVTIEARNLTDERIEDVMGFPLPGRSVYATVLVEL
jgi:outer membrane receptor protein involved in Fe transport